LITTLSFPGHSRGELHFCFTRSQKPFFTNDCSYSFKSVRFSFYCSISLQTLLSKSLIEGGLGKDALLTGQSESMVGLWLLGH
jgi:hypothetical protein